MKALSHFLPPAVRLMPGRGLFTLVLVFALLGIEVVGRQATSDLHDGLAALALVTVGMVVAMRHRRDPLPWIERIAEWGQRGVGMLDTLRYEHGVDLRGTPPVPRKTPPVVAYVLLGLVGWGVLSALAWAVFPHGWRDLGVHSLYTVYLLMLVSLWVALLACFIVGVFVPVALLDRWLKGWVGETDRRGLDLAAVVGYAVLVSIIACAVPPVAILGMCLAVAAAAVFVYLPRGGDGAAILWRAKPDQPVYAVPIRRVLAAVTGIVALFVFNILLMACGGRSSIADPSADSMPITGLIGAITAWTMPLLLVVGGLRLLSARRHDPARRSPATARLTGKLPAREMQQAARLVNRWGWRTRSATQSRERGDVGLQIVEAERSEATEFDPGWPLKVSLEDLEAGTVRSRFERRDEIQLRRLFFRGLTKLFKRAAPFKGPGGGGLWLAPQWWFIEGIGREDADAMPDETGAPKLVGPPYHRVFTTRARQHLHQVLRSTQVDMIFIEDGVTYRKVEKVMRVLLELYDVHAGRRPAEEMHFRGLPKVRVMIHDYEPGNPFESDVYPEPKFDDLSRVRVLHIFRDRGGHEERVEPPADFSWTPAPAGMMG